MATTNFQALTVKATGRLNRIITDVEVSLGFDPKIPPNPPPDRVPTKALWDTGASSSVISTALVKTLGLKPVGQRQVHHGDGCSTRPTYIVNFYLPNGVGILGIIATDFPASHAEFDVLIGMDVICFGDFSITNVAGKTWMTFRTPSCATIDYVVEANRLTFAGVERNAPCPCGSGKKYKKCHG